MNILNTSTAENNQNKKSVKKNILTILSILIGASVLFAAAIVITGNDAFASLSQRNLSEDWSETSVQMQGDEFFKAASDGAPIPQTDVLAYAEPKPATPATTAQPTPATKTTTAATPAQSTKKKETSPQVESMVTVNLQANVGRTNPFVPTMNYSSSSLGLPSVPSGRYPAPPKELIQNETATKLMETTISGIMYDAFAPSAIVSIEGQDHLVRKGDRINGYKIINITKDRVIVQNGTNIYRATVGETLTTENAINYNNVYNLEQKFGGTNAPKGTTMIHIN